MTVISYRKPVERTIPAVIAPRPTDLLTVKQVAALLHVSPMTVYRRVHNGELRALKIGRAFRVRRDDATAFIQSCEFTPKEEW